MSNETDGRPPANDPRPTTSRWELINRSTAIIAFIVSLTTAYFTVIRRTDDLSFTIPNLPPLIFIDDETSQLRLQSLEQNLAFVNFGTEAIALLDQWLMFSDIRSKCTKGVSLIYKTPPIVLKAGDVIVHQLGATSADSNWKPGKPIGTGGTVLLDKSSYSPNVGDEVLVCMHFRVITAGNETALVDIPLYSTKLQKGSNLTLGNLPNWYTATRDLDKPITIFHRFGTVFD